MHLRRDSQRTRHSAQVVDEITIARLARMHRERIEDPARRSVRSRTEDAVFLFDSLQPLGVGLIHEPGKYTASPHRTSGQVAVPSSDSATRSSANLARTRGPIPGIRARAA